ncbi:MAG: SBBP repeat-containing protein [Bacteroidales bacterium]|nr:SBBP repeat-containing protein [Bacteroidales bacterium]
MKYYILTGIIFLLGLISQAQDWMWHKQMESVELNRPVSTVYKNGKIFFSGEFLGSLTYDGQNLSTFGDRDGYIARMSDNGDLEWIKQIGSSGTDWLQQLAFDESGNIYVSGSTSGTCNFSGTNISHSDNYDGFVAKYDINGNLLWAKNLIWGTNLQRIVSLTVDSDNNIIISGYFTEEITFGDISTPASCVSEAITTTNLFLAKFDNNGNNIWHKVFTSDNNARFPAVKAFGTDIFVGGFFRGNLIYETDTFKSNMTAYDDIIVLKLNSSGNFIWNRMMGGSNHDRISSIDIDNSGDIYLSGYYKSADLKLASDETNTVNSSFAQYGDYDLFAAKYSNSGSLVWYDLIGGTGSDSYINSEIKDNVWLLTGVYTNSINFPHGSLDSIGTNTNSFFVTYNTQGNTLLLGSIAGLEADRGVACTIDDNNGLYVSSLMRSLSFTAGSENINNTSTSGNVLISKFGCFEVLSSSSTPVKCVDGMGIPYSNDGTASAFPEGGKEPYQYSWSNGGNTQVISGLDVGNYTVTVLDNSGCSLTSTVTVNYLPHVSSAIISSSNVTCNGYANGSATVSASNGNPPYSYNWTGGSSSTTASNLSGGTNYVTVTDMCGNMSVNSVVINEPTALGLSLTGSLYNYGGTCIARVYANASGGTPAYSYVWGVYSGGIIQNNGSNVWVYADAYYSISLTDNNGCNISGWFYVPGCNKSSTEPDTDLDYLSWDSYMEIEIVEGTDDPVEELEGTTVSVDEAKVFEIKVFPNPATNIISIEIPENFSGDYKIAIYDVLGNKLKTSNSSLDKSNIQINISAYPSGSYSGIISTNMGDYVFRFVKL